MMNLLPNFLHDTYLLHVHCMSGLKPNPGSPQVNRILSLSGRNTKRRQSSFLAKVLSSMYKALRQHRGQRALGQGRQRKDVRNGLLEEGCLN
jgi:hypothetical protein